MFSIVTSVRPLTPDWTIKKQTIKESIIYKHSHIHTFTHKHTHSHTSIHIHTQAYTFTHNHAHTHSHTSIHIHTPSYSHIHFGTLICINISPAGYLVTSKGENSLHGSSVDLLKTIYVSDDSRQSFAHITNRTIL